MTDKKCRKCGEKKELTTEFFPRNKRSSDGFDSRCKECWKVIQREKRARKSEGGSSASGPKAHVKQAQQAIIKKAKDDSGGGSGMLSYEYNPKSRMPMEMVPPDIEVHALRRYSDLPKDGVEFMEWHGTLEEGLQWFLHKHGRMPEVIFAPAQYFLQVTPKKEKEVEKKSTTRNPAKKKPKQKASAGKPKKSARVRKSKKE